jgi:hypothetical protein
MVAVAQTACGGRMIMAETKEMDKLSQDAMAARRAGMSYGKWKAMQDPVVIEPKPDRKVVRRGVCRYCGKDFAMYDHRFRVYCSEECRELNWSKVLCERRKEGRNDGD